jgi:hypothetical protein
MEEEGDLVYDHDPEEWERLSWEEKQRTIIPKMQSVIDEYLADFWKAVSVEVSQASQ